MGENKGMEGKVICGIGFRGRTKAWPNIEIFFPEVKGFGPESFVISFKPLPAVHLNFRNV